jgi:predicted secreted protein
MSWISGIAVYFCIWWVVIFAVLPWGVRPIEENDKGFDPGAPQNPRLLVKAVATTIISFILWGILYAIVQSDLLSFRS